MKDSNKTFFCIKKVGFAIILFATTLFSVKAQVTILNANISPYNITPRTLLDASINNTKNDVQVIMQAKIISASGEVLVDVTSGFFLLKKGLTNSGQITIPINSVVYGSGEKTNMIKSSHSLPSGKYSYCATITAIDVAEQYCQDMESESSSFLFLVFPPDKDEIETRYPVLTWTHSEPFALTNQNEFFRVMVVELSKGQSPEAAVNTNIPVYMKNYLTSHQVQYPIDAKELQAGKSYAWQVQKISGGTIVNKTEAWEFKLKIRQAPLENKYARLKKEVDGSVYKVENNKIYFRFDEGYAGKKMYYKIINDKQQALSPAKNEAEGGEVKIDSIKEGYNTYTIDLNEYKIPAGVYLLEVINEKREVYKLKFSVE